MQNHACYTLCERGKGKVPSCSRSQASTCVKNDAQVYLAAIRMGLRPQRLYFCEFEARKVQSQSPQSPQGHGYGDETLGASRWAMALTPVSLRSTPPLPTSGEGGFLLGTVGKVALHRTRRHARPTTCHVEPKAKHLAQVVASAGLCDAAGAERGTAGLGRARSV